RSLVSGTAGVAEVMDEVGKRERHLDHPRSGDLVALAEPDAWFTYYYWLDDERAPDYARTVDIHRKPGFDPVELFIDPELKLPQAKVGLTLLKKQLGFRYLMEVIPLDASLVRGSHGLPTPPGAGPLFMTERPDLLSAPAIDATGVCDLMLRHLQTDGA
ncbi:MAG TPA: hypothetical protein VFY42_02560, partial [Gemmatimonadales bacterium]|nr:hypothetical protein [Gemmatimonadales bacterium]